MHEMMTNIQHTYTQDNKDLYTIFCPHQGACFNSLPVELVNINQVLCLNYLPVELVNINLVLFKMGESEDQKINFINAETSK